MNRIFSTLAVVLTAVVMLALAPAAHAQATRTWVSGVGDDANPCSRTAPCKTFAGAISKTAAGGEINTIDDGAYGAVTITKAITINGSGNFAGVLASGAGVNGIVVNAGVNDVVVLRGLTLTGVNGALNAVRYLAAKYLVVEDSHITGYANGINMAVTVVNGRLDVRNTTITNGSWAPNTFGIHIGPPNSISTISNVTVRGFAFGVTTRDGQTFMRGSDLVNNEVGYSNQGGALFSFGDNMVNANANNGLPSGLITKF